jgi:hypothetical protein
MGEDAAMDARLRTRNVAVRPPLSMREWAYIYRWGVSPLHLSAGGALTLWETIGERPIEPGEFVLNPHWEQDYTALTRAYVFMLNCQE